MLFRSGLAQGSLKQYKQAIADYNTAIDLDPKYARAYNNRGVAYDALGQYEQAIADYNTAIELDHDPLARPYNNRGWAYRNLGQYERAIEDYNTAIDLDPEYATAYNNRGNTYRRLEDYEAALADYGRAIELNPDNARFYNSRGIVYEKEKQFTLAIADYQEALKLDPDYYYAHNNLAGCYLALGQLQQASHHFAQRITGSPANALNAQVTLGIITYHQNQLAEAQNHFATALNLWDTVWEQELQSRSGLLENKALALLGLNRPAEALTTLQDALAQRLPGDTFDDLTRYDLLATAPQPPVGLADLRRLLDEIQEET